MLLVLKPCCTAYVIYTVSACACMSQEMGVLGVARCRPLRRRRLKHQTVPPRCGFMDDDGTAGESTIPLLLWCDRAGKITPLYTTTTSSTTTTNTFTKCVRVCLCTYMYLYILYCMSTITPLPTPPCTHTHTHKGAHGTWMSMGQVDLGVF